MLSMSVDLSWSSTSRETGPMMPVLNIQQYMSQQLVKAKLAVLKSVELAIDKNQNNERLTSKLQIKQRLKKTRKNLGSMSISLTKSCTSRSAPVSSPVQTNYKDPELPQSLQFKAVGTAVDDAGQIYILLKDRQEQENMVKRSLKCDPRLKRARPCCGENHSQLSSLQDCVTLAENGYWYRTRFLGYKPDSDLEKAYVMFLDYGDTSTVMSLNIVVILVCPEIPILVLRVVLHNLAPVGGSPWPHKLVDFVHSKVVLDIPDTWLTVRVLGVMVTTPLQCSILLPPIDPDKVRVDLSELVLVNSSLFSVNMAEPGRPGDSEAIESLRQKLSYGVGCVPSSKQTTSRYEGVGPFPQLDLVYPDLPRLFIRVVHMHGQVMCVQPVEITKGTGRHGSLSLVARQFRETYLSLQQVAQVSPPVISPSLGMAVAVQARGGWSRGLVVQVHNKVIVKFVDWGWEQVVDRRRLKFITEELVMGSPAQCVEIVVDGRDIKTVKVGNIVQVQLEEGEGLHGHVVKIVKEKVTDQ